MNNQNLECVNIIKDIKIKSSKEIFKDIIKKKWKRNCPKCNTELIYSSYDSWWKSNKINSKCQSCSKKGMPNGRLGKKHTELTKRKISHSHQGKKLTEETRRKLLVAWKKRKIYYPTTEETKKKCQNLLKDEYFQIIIS